MVFQAWPGGHDTGNLESVVVVVVVVVRSTSNKVVVLLHSNLNFAPIGEGRDKVEK